MRCVDLALKSGFGWQKGIFEQAQLTGWSAMRDNLIADIDSGKVLLEEPLPSWVSDRSFVIAKKVPLIQKRSIYSEIFSSCL